MPEKFVAQSACDSRRKITLRLFSAVIAFLGLCVSVSWWSVCVGYEAIRNATEVRIEVETHIAADEPRYAEIHRSLQRIETTQVRVSERLDKFFEKSGE